MRLDELRELGGAHRAGLLGGVEQLLDLLVAEEMVDVDRRHGGGESLEGFLPGASAIETPLSSLCTGIGVMSS